MGPTDIELAWLAGLLDGEGSIGIANQNGKTGASNRTTVQLLMTHKETIDRALEIVTAIGCKAFTYRYQGRKPTIEKDLSLLVIRRSWDIRLLAQQMIRFSVTKRLQWELMLEYCESRLVGVSLDGEGQVVREGSKKWWNPLSPREREIFETLKGENRRGKA